MSTKKKMMMSAAGSAGGGGLNVEDVFSTYLTGAPGAGTHSISNGIDLSGEGGMVWGKARTAAAASHEIVDTERGISNGALQSNTTNAAGSANTDFSSFTSTGFQISSSGSGNLTYYDAATWTFRKAPKFFDVVTFSGNTSGVTVSHNLGSNVGFIVVKRTDSTSSWTCWHRNDGSSPLRFSLESTLAGFAASGQWGTVDSSSFSMVSGATDTGATYVAYLFAHNDGDGEFGPDGDADIIKCGSYTGSGADNNFIDIGFEPQWLLTKRTDSTGNWNLVDNMRAFTSRPFSGAGVESYSLRLSANSNGAESQYWQQHVDASGVILDSANTDSNASGGNYIYMAIRRGPLAVPEDATDVFDIATRDATPPAFNAPFDVDMSLYKSNITSNEDNFNSARLIQGEVLRTNSTAAEISGGTGFVFDYSGGWYGPTSANSNAYSWMWKRAPGFFDVVAYTGTGQPSRSITHNLGVSPELVVVKSRSASGNWFTWCSELGNDNHFFLNSSAVSQSSSLYMRSATDTVFNLGTQSSGVGVNSSGVTHIMYLFASLDGVSKVGSYTGNGSSLGDTQTIDCGFSSGARFVLIKRTSGTGEWFVFDTERGIVSGSDAYLTLHSNAGQVSGGDYIDPHSSGFTVVQHPATETNTNGETYIFYAIA